MRLRPLSCAIQDAHDEHDIRSNYVDDNARQRRVREYPLAFRDGRGAEREKARLMRRRRDGSDLARVLPE